MKKKISGSVAGLLLLAAGSLFAVGENVGRITGVVRETTSSSPIAGATVTVTGDALIGPPRVTQTGVNGSYEILNLPPGTYDVTVSVSGANPVSRRVLVRSNEATPVEVAWSAEITGEQVTIVAQEVHPTRPDSSMTGSTFTMEKQNNLPIARQYQSVVTMTPGVTVNVGGNPSIKGGNSRNNRILIDGLDTSDPNTNTFSANINQDSLAEIQVLTGGFEAKYNALGGIQNLVTNSGGDQFHLDVSTYIRTNQTQDFFGTGPNLYNGVRPFAGADQPPTQNYDSSINVNGPILKHKLWYSAGLEWVHTSAVQPAGPPLNVQAPNRVANGYFPRMKLTWAPNENHKVTLEGMGDPLAFDYVNNSGNQANQVTPLAAVTQWQGGYKAIGEWDYFVTPNVNTKILGGYSYNSIDAGPQGLIRSVDPKYGTYNASVPGHLNQDDNTQWFNQNQRQTLWRQRWQFDGAMQWRTSAAGQHEAEVGLQTAILTNRQQTVFLGDTGVPGQGAFFRDLGGGTGQGGLCQAAPTPGVQQAVVPNNGAGCSSLVVGQNTLTSQRGHTIGVYAQDRFKPVRWLTLLPGLRFDWSRAYINATGDALRLDGLSPRFSAIFDLTGDEKTIFQASYGHATEMLYLSPLNQVDGTLKSAPVSYTWVKNAAGTGGAFVAPSATAVPVGALVDRNAHVPPHSDELVGSLRRELFTNSVGSIEYTYKRTSNVVTSVETNYIYDPTGNRVVGFADGLNHSVQMVTFPDSNKIYYSGFDFIFESRPIPNLDFLGSYTLSWTYGPGYQDANAGAGVSSPSARFDQYANLRQSNFAYGYAPNIDTRHNIKTGLTYSFHGATIGTVVTWRSGIAQQAQYNTVNAGIVPPRFRTPNGLQPAVPNDVTQWTELRTPDLFLVNLTGTYDFYELTRQHLIAQATIFNLFDASTPTGIQNIVVNPNTGTFGQVATRTTPLQLQIGLRYQY
jgi:Carboxypeptidase regulatory-like domain/TonB-dependent Receptor Plug Domain